jgi:hypothetical protein
VRGWPLFAACSVAAALGLIMILLKDLVLIHLHQLPAGPAEID